MAQVTELLVNGARRGVSADPDRPLLSVLRDDLDLTGTKYGCGEGECAAGAVLVDGQPVHSGTPQVGTVAGKRLRSLPRAPEHG